MRRFSIQRTDERLILRRQRASYLPSLVALLLLSTALTVTCRMHTPGVALLWGWQDTEFFSMSALLCLTLAARGLLGLRRFEIVFDRRIGVAFINERAFLSLCELQSVHLDRDLVGNHVLSLRARSGARFEVGRDGSFGLSRRELEELAQEMAEFTGSDLVTPDRFVAGADEFSGGSTPWPGPGTMGRMKRGKRQVAGRAKQRHRPPATLRRERTADGRIYFAEFGGVLKVNPQTRPTNLRPKAGAPEVNVGDLRAVG